MGQFNEKGREYRLELPDEGMFDELGSPYFGWRRLNLADAIASADPGSRLASAATDGGYGVGISIPLNGGWGSTDWSGAWPYWIFNFEDAFGMPLSSASSISLNFVMVARGTPWVSSDECAVDIAIVNETVTTGATVDGQGGGIVGTGGSGFLAGQRVSTVNGTGAVSNGAGVSGVAGATGAISLQGIGSSTRLSHSSISGIDSSGAFVSGAGASTATTTTIGASGRLYLVLTAGRLSAGAAGAVTPRVDVFVQPTISCREFVP